MSADIFDTQFLARLRQAIFLHKNGHCLAPAELKALYRDSKVLNGTVLAHVVHCAGCLDQINQLRGLPPLSERQAENGEGRERPPRNPGGNSGPRNSSISARTSGRLAAPTRKALQHLPAELRIVVNGIELGGQSIKTAFNQLSLPVNLPPKITSFL